MNFLFVGQAFAIFKTSEAANKIVEKLSEECLMLPIGRFVGLRTFIYIILLALVSGDLGWRDRHCLGFIL